MNKKIVSGAVVLGIIVVSLSYQNCAKISYSNDDGLISKNTIDGTLDTGPGPTNPDIIELPESAKRKMSVAFEDLMTKTNYSSNTDIDYNDFVMTYSVREENAGGFLKKIEITVTPQAREAGYEAQLILSLSGALAESGEKIAVASFNNSTGVTGKIEYFDENDKLVSSTAVNVTKPIIVFKKTSEVFVSKSANLDAGTSASPIKVLCKEKAKLKAKITVTGFTARAENKARTAIDLKRYPFYLYVEPTQTLMGTVDLNPSHKTKDGFPLSFQIPGTYLHPADKVNISSVYPYFDDYVKLLKGTAMDAATTQKAKTWYEWLQNNWASKLACTPVN